MSDRITQYGMRLFIDGLADTLVEFQQTPLDDRDSHWIMRRLRYHLETSTFRTDIPEHHKASMVALFHRLDWYCLVRDLQVKYRQDGDCEW